jgi:cytochrome c oxidase cbb3-type subunit 3
MDHEYDGIQEYDNPMPEWWVALFIVTVIFSVFYAVYYFAPMPERALHATYAVSVDEDLKLQFAQIGTLKNTPEALAAYIRREELVEMGQRIFRSNCVSCHAAEGQGLIGPNLTDNVYKNIKKIEDIAVVIDKGANNGAMPAWGDRLVPNEVILSAIYVASIRGKNLTSTRPAEGVEIPPWPLPDAAPQDGVKISVGK